MYEQESDIEEDKNTSASTPHKKRRKSRVIFSSWSKHETKQLISSFEDHPSLWNTSLPNYRDIHMKNKIIEKIAAQMNKDPQDVKIKWQNLRCQLNGEIRKMKTKSGHGSGKGFVSRWDYFNAMKFICRREIKATTTSNFEESILESSSNSADETSTNDSNFTQSTSLSNKQQRKIVSTQSNLQKESLFNTTFETMQKPMDSSQIFGDFVADQLRQLTPKKQKKLQRMIQQDILLICDELEEQQNQQSLQYLVVKDQCNCGQCICNSRMQDSPSKTPEPHDILEISMT